MPPVIGLMDCNNFFVSCEQVFNPALLGKPVVVLSNNDGCIISRSPEAKAIGIRMGQPLHELWPLIRQHHVKLISANFSLYGDMSRRVLTVLDQYTALKEIYSIDEAFFDCSGIPPGERAAYARSLQHTVRRWTGLPVSIGIAQNKTLAKAAGDLAKQSPRLKGILDLTRTGYRERALHKLQVGEVWGVGWRLSERLNRHSVHTAWELSQKPDDWLLSGFSVTLVKTVHELRGTACLPLSSEVSPRKSIHCSRSFGTLIESRSQLREAVSTFAARAAEKLRGHQMMSNRLTLYIRTPKQRPNLPQYHNATEQRLSVPTDCSRTLIRQALTALEAIYRPGYHYYKAGIVLSDLSPAMEHQLSLFTPDNPEKTRAMMHCLDRLNLRYGHGTLRYGVEGLKRPWAGKRQHQAQDYTTLWEGIPVIRS